jgi:hypothetical protein
MLAVLVLGLASGVMLAFAVVFAVVLVVLSLGLFLALLVLALLALSFPFPLSLAVLPLPFALAALGLSLALALGFALANDGNLGIGWRGGGGGWERLERNRGVNPGGNGLGAGEGTVGRLRRQGPRCSGQSSTDGNNWSLHVDEEYHRHGKRLTEGCCGQETNERSDVVGNGRNRKPRWENGIYIANLRPPETLLTNTAGNHGSEWARAWPGQ